MNGNFYYYKNRREGGRVVSEYIGGGAAALLAAQQDKEQAQEEAREREAFERRKAEMLSTELEVDKALALLVQLAEAEMIAAGYHTHKRQWRKRRYEQIS